MLSHRPYMRGDYQQEKTSALTWLLSAIIAGFVLQLAMGSPWLGNGGLKPEKVFGLTIPALQNGWLWTLLTHSFLHSTGFIFHVIVNCLVLYFLGRELIPILGTRRFMGVYAAATVIGGLAWVAAHWRFGAGEPHIGTTAAVDALFVVFACFFPNQELNFLLFFVVPVTIKPKHLAYALALVDLIALFIYELPGARLPFDLGLSSSAHLGGMLTGLIYARFVHHARWFNPDDRAEGELSRWLKPPRKTATAIAPAESEALPAASSREDIRAELDRILDKINGQGLGSLTADEKRLLDGAKDLLSPP